jgi:glycosyltransferase involved in cell wall biosynthesis
MPAFASAPGTGIECAPQATSDCACPAAARPLRYASRKRWRRMSTSHDRPALSACIITFNEADRIDACIDSLAFCDEIVVVDSGSTDGTRERAAAKGARVFERAFEGYRSQKDFAVKTAHSDWVLCLDADERVTPTLRASIERERERGFAGNAGYRFARLTEYFGAWLRHGNAYPDRVMRLFDRRRGGWRGRREIHEHASVDGSVTTLAGNLEHVPYRSLSDHLDRIERYARMMAEHMHANGRKASLVNIVVNPFWRFVRGYVLRGGFRDGWRGLIYAYVKANYVRQKFIKLWLLGHGYRL